MRMGNFFILSLWQFSVLPAWPVSQGLVWGRERGDQVKGDDVAMRRMGAGKGRGEGWCKERKIALILGDDVAMRRICARRERRVVFAGIKPSSG